MVGKVEYLPKGANPRSVVTSVFAQAWEARALYEEVYCARGDMENRIKERQLGLFADRTSAATMHKVWVLLACGSPYAALFAQAHTTTCAPRP